MSILQTTPPKGWSKDAIDLGYDSNSHWADGETMVNEYKLGQATPIMCMMTGERIVLVSASKGFYLWSPIDGEVWKIMEPEGGLDKVVSAIGEGGLASLTCLKVDL